MSRNRHGFPMVHHRWRGLLVVTFLVVAAGCSGSDAAAVGAGEGATGQPCVPGPAGSAGIAEVAEGRRGEALVEYLTGIDELGRDPALEGVEIIYDDPNFGGVWGDFEGGWVVAILDCDQVDLDQIARLAGGPDVVRIIQVPHTFEQVNELSDRLKAELRSIGVRGEVGIDSTLSGRHITVLVEDRDQLDSDFGRDLPAGAWSVQEGELSQPARG